MTEANAANTPLRSVWTPSVIVLSAMPGPVLTPLELEPPPLLDLPHAATASAAPRSAAITRALRMRRRLMRRSPSTRARHRPRDKARDGRQALRGGQCADPTTARAAVRGFPEVGATRREGDHHAGGARPAFSPS